MGFVWEATLRCSNCDAAFKGRPIEYDDLGYPVCPACGEVQRPSPARARPATGDLAE
ncbi:MAG: hypothetical protein V5A46_06690 [Haloferacaceae archaeon]